MNRYPDDWGDLRNQTYERDGYQCRNCGVQGGPLGDAELHAHHIVPRSMGGNNIKSNLVTLCDNCHFKIHSHMSDSSLSTKTNDDEDNKGIQKERMEVTGEVVNTGDPIIIEDTSRGRMKVGTKKELSSGEIITVRGKESNGYIDADQVEIKSNNSSDESNNQTTKDRPLTEDHRKYIDGYGGL